MAGLASRDSADKVRAEITGIPVFHKKPRDLTSFGFEIRRNKAEEAVLTGVEIVHVPTPDDKSKESDSVPREHPRAFVKVLMSFGQEEVEKFLNATGGNEQAIFKRYHEERTHDAGRKPFSPQRKRKLTEFNHGTRKQEDPDFDPAIGGDTPKKEYLSREYMERVLKFVDEHPELPFADIKKNFGALKDESQIMRFRRFRAGLANPFSRIGTYAELNDFCDEMVLKHRARGEEINDNDIRMWAFEKADDLLLWRFVASPRWLREVKRRNGLLLYQRLGYYVVSSGAFDVSS